MDGTQRQHSGDLQRVIALNEEIKAVVDVSRTLSLEAINAMLASRRAGDAVKGFGVVSTELRAFSGMLTGIMQTLTLDIATLVQGVANYSREQRLRLRLTTTHAACANCPGLNQAMGRLDLILARTTTSNARLWTKVQRSLQRSQKLCDTGRALTRSAMIEAVYGGSMRSDLGQASLAIERTIEQIRQRLQVGAALAGTAS